MKTKWQDERDVRTDSCANVTSEYKQKSVHVIMSTNHNYGFQLMTEITVSILARWCRNILMTSEDQPDLINDSGSFNQKLVRIVKGIDPECKFSVNPTDPSPNVTVFIGHSNERVRGSYICIDAFDWVSVCSYNQKYSASGTSRYNPLSLVFAACLGNAEAFRLLNNIQPQKPYLNWYSLWTNKKYSSPPSESDSGTVLPERVNFGRIHLIGCGAIGSSFVYLFPLLKFTGDFLLVDPDFVKSFNTSSSLLFKHQDAVNRLQKANICVDYLKAAGLQSEPYHDYYSTWPYEHNTSTIKGADVILCFANEKNIWSTIQNICPPLTFHATTSKSWGINVGRHIPLIENCLLCTFQDMIQTDFTPTCSEGEIPGTDEDDPGHTAILPFLSPAAAVLTLSELVKVTNGQFLSDNTTIFNMSVSTGTFVTDYSPFGSCYLCSKQKEVYPTFGPSSKFWILSKTGELDLSTSNK